jgi:hypothetical protein
MLRTYYAGGRASLPTPSITTDTGAMNGSGTTYYFWIKARNRVGWNLPSPSLSLVIGGASNLIINATNFSKFIYEDWREMIITMSTTNNYSTSSVIYRQDLYSDDDITPTIISNVIISNQYVLNGSRIIATPALLPTSVLPEGFRLRITSLNNTYEYRINSFLIPDNLTVIQGTANSQWLLVESNSLTEVDTNYDKELYQVTSDDFTSISLPSSNSIEVPIKYFIKNTGSNALESGELDLNVYLSDRSLSISYKIKVLGYFDHLTNTLDTTGIQYINSVVTYPGTNITLDKDLPVDSSFVIEVLPELGIGNTILPGSFISMYPRLNTYTTVDEILTWAEGVTNIASLQAIPTTLIKDQQSVQVASVNRIYTYNSLSTLTANGSDVVAPSTNPATGRWLANTAVILDASIGYSKLDSSITTLLDENIDTNTVTIANSQTYIINLLSIGKDYLIINTPVDDGDDTIINTIATGITNNSNYAIVIELRQNTGTVLFDSSILFPGGTSPTLSGNGLNDLILLTITKDGAGVVKKRGMLLQKNIG